MDFSVTISKDRVGAARQLIAREGWSNLRVSEAGRDATVVNDPEIEPEDDVEAVLDGLAEIARGTQHDNQCVLVESELPWESFRVCLTDGHAYEVEVLGVKREGVGSELNVALRFGDKDYTGTLHISENQPR